MVAQFSTGILAHFSISIYTVLIADVEVGEFETSVDVSADTMQYAMYERRVPPIPAGQKDTTGDYLKGNPHVKLTKSH